jgi:hypothetical protein
VKTIMELLAGPKSARLEALVQVPLSNAINEVAAEISGDQDPKKFRSEAARILIAEAVVARAARVPVA